jgi:salicylate hydroxylase
VSAARHIIIAGAGIGGLTAALALAARGFRVSVFEQAVRLEEIGAGIQLSPNATRTLRDLGVAERLAPSIVVPQALVVHSAATGRQIVRMPLGADAEQRYGAPYWMVHRADLQTALLQAVTGNPDIAVTFGAKVEDYTIHPDGVTATVQRAGGRTAEHGAALIGADGLWSALRERAGNHDAPRFCRRTAWRSLIAADMVPPEYRDAVVHLWLGASAHLVHYPVRGGAAINVVVIVEDAAARSGWSGEGAGEALMARLSVAAWSQDARALLRLAPTWQTWSLYDLPALPHWGEGPVTLLGDAAHPMLPFLAQGACMAIEDAAVLAGSLAQSPGDTSFALRAYEQARGERTAQVQNASRRNGAIYHHAGLMASLRDIGMRIMGGDRLIARYNWIYRWRDTVP